jgi:hypothetical protein
MDPGHNWTFLIILSKIQNNVYASKNHSISTGQVQKTILWGCSEYLGPQLEAHKSKDRAEEQGNIFLHSGWYLKT